MQQKYSFLLLPVLAVLVIYSCQSPEIKPDPESAPAKDQTAITKSKKIDNRIVIVTEVKSDSDHVKFYYNEKDQLTSLKMYKLDEKQHVRDSMTGVLKYKNGKPIAYQPTWTENGSKQTANIELVYDNQGRIVRTFSYGRIGVHFTYNDDGKLTGYTTQNNKKLNWQYDQNGNAYRIKSVTPVPAESDAPRGDNHYSGKYQFDDNINPFRHNSLGTLLYILGMGGEYFQYLSQNNPVEVIEDLTYVTRKPLDNYKSSGTKTVYTFLNKYDENDIITESAMGTKVQYFTDEKPDEFQKDMITKRPTLQFKCFVRENEKSKSN